jgi:NAD(P)H-hydrate repair Nnr-like enzyme with NAD(P)H-hydrate dehydratase domain
MSKSAINSPEIWLDHFPGPKPEGNKYDRGHAVVLGGPINSAGAAKLAARSALRIGAGLVSVACNETSLPIYAASFQAIMTKLIASPDDFAALVEDEHVTGILVGPGAGVNLYIKNCVLSALSKKKPTVLDADALTAFSEDRKTLF